MAAAGLGSHDFTRIVLEKKKEFLLHRHRTLQVAEKGLWIRFLLISHRCPLLPETDCLHSRFYRLPKFQLASV